MRLTRTDRLLALAVSLATFVVAWAAHRPVGHVRDEGYYFEAAQRYQGWFLQIGRDFSAGRFLEPFRDAVIARHWEYNHEHPVIAKTAFALSHLVFNRWLGWLDDTTAYRLPTFAFAALLSLSLFLVARRYGRWAAVLAPALFWAAPRHLFHAELSTFDVPVAAMWCLFVAVYARYLETGRGALLSGVVFGLTIATKHNGFFLPIVVVLHWLLTDWRDLRAAGVRGVIGRIPNAMWAMALVGPIVLYVSWPWLWHHPIERVRWWLGFHQHHVHYPWQYLGRVLRGPPFPWAYPLVLEWLTLPAATLAAIVLGSLSSLAGAAGAFSRRVRARFGEWTRVDWFVALSAFIAIAPFLTTRVPIFGGIKHWLPAIALLCIPAAKLLAEAGRAMLPRHAHVATAALAALVLAPGVVYTAHFHPFGTSAYNELAGGAAGGAALGMQRQYWSNNVTAVLPWINEHAARNAAVYFHEVNHESFRAYQADGLVRRDLRYAWSPQEASVAAYQYHQEFRDREFEIWGEFGTRVPALSFAIDEAPQVVVYVRRR